MDSTDLRSLLERVNSQAGDLLNQLEELRKNNTSLTEKFEAREQAFVELQETHEIEIGDLADCHATTLKEARNKTKAVQTEHDALRQHCDEVERKLDEERRGYHALTGTKDLLEEQLQDIALEVQHLKGKEQELDALQIKHDDLAQQLQEQKLENRHLKAKLKDATKSSRSAAIDYPTPTTITRVDSVASTQPQGADATATLLDTEDQASAMPSIEQASPAAEAAETEARVIFSPFAVLEPQDDGYVAFDEDDPSHLDKATWKDGWERDNGALLKALVDNAQESNKLPVNLRQHDWSLSLISWPTCQHESANFDCLTCVRHATGQAAAENMMREAAGVLPEADEEAGFNVQEIPACKPSSPIVIQAQPEAVQPGAVQQEPVKTETVRSEIVYPDNIQGPKPSFKAFHLKKPSIRRPDSMLNTPATPLQSPKALEIQRKLSNAKGQVAERPIPSPLTPQESCLGQRFVPAKESFLLSDQGRHETSDPRRSSIKRPLSPIKKDHPSKRHRSGGKPCCLRCWKLGHYCKRGPHCANCIRGKAGRAQCVYMLCKWGSSCWTQNCVYMHPGQYDKTDRRYNVEEGDLGTRGEWKSNVFPDLYRP